jgi:Zn-dependent M28 family amino/carboxypeptidase
MTARMFADPDVLLNDVELFASRLGERHDGSPLHHERLRSAANRIEERFAGCGFCTRRESYAGQEGRWVENIIAERRGTAAADDIVVIGAHYDSIRGGPGADDNATGVAALLAVAQALGDVTPERTVRLVAFANEEHPHTRRRTMGSLVHARNCRKRREHVVAMVSLECLGFYVGGSARRSDATPWHRLLPFSNDGAFVVSNVRSRKLAGEVATALRESGDVPIHRVALPGFLPLAKSSDHWSFWKNGYPAVMITDSAPLRYRHYHRKSDTADRIVPEALAALTRAICVTATRLAWQ